MTVTTPPRQQQVPRPQADASPSASPVRTEGATPSLDSDVLLQGRSSVVITHRGARYRLQATRQGKLILTK